MTDGERRARSSWGKRAWYLGALVLAVLLGNGGARVAKMGESALERLAQTRRAAKAWPALVEAGQVVSDGAGPVLVEFGDYECPFCRQSQVAVDSLIATVPGVRVVFEQLPLKTHKRALTASRAVLCTDSNEQRRSLHRYLFAQHEWQSDTFDWQELAASVGVSDLPRFRRCLEETGNLPPEVSAADQLAKVIGLSGTPVFIVKGGRLHEGLATVADLRRLLEVEG